MLKIYGHAGSINVPKVLWLCAELGLDFAREDWGGRFRSTVESEFRALNPFGMIPVIDDEGFVLAESNAILRYLAASRARHDLLPAEARPRARVEAWMDWQASDFNKSWRAVFQARVRNNPAVSAEAAESSAVAFNEAVGNVDAALADGRDFLCGGFSLADIVIGLSLHRWKSVPMARPALMHVDAYYARLCERPSFQRYGRDGGA
ncbi:MAG: glutathione S-transferase family protein [Parvibaculum sp.]